MARYQAKGDQTLTTTLTWTMFSPLSTVGRLLYPILSLVARSATKVRGIASPRRVFDFGSPRHDKAHSKG